MELIDYLAIAALVLGITGNYLRNHPLLRHQLLVLGAVFGGLWAVAIAAVVTFDRPVFRLILGASLVAFLLPETARAFRVAGNARAREDSA